jgi:hypothetical protein
MDNKDMSSLDGNFLEGQSSIPQSQCSKFNVSPNHVPKVCMKANG